MMLGVELVEDKEAKTPAPAAAAYVLERARQMGVHIQVCSHALNIASSCFAPLPLSPSSPLCSKGILSILSFFLLSFPCP